MYIPPLLLLVPEFAADFCEENEQLFDAICLRKYELSENSVIFLEGNASLGYVVNHLYSGGRACGRSALPAGFQLTYACGHVCLLREDDDYGEYGRGDADFSEQYGWLFGHGDGNGNS